MKFNNRNVYISPTAKIGQNVRIGDNTVIYDNVVIGDNTIIANDCVIGEPLNDYYHQADYTNPETHIGANSVIRSHTLIYCDTKLGEGFSCGHRVTIREKAVMGINCRVGTLCDIQGHVTFGNYCWLHSNVHIGQQSTIGNFVFIYPYVVFTNDPYPPSNTVIGPTVGDYAQIAVHAIILPGIKIGENSMVGANATVTRDVAEFSVVSGSPAKHMCDIRDIKSKTDGSPNYPWMYRFERGMPWQGIGFDAWKKQQEQ